MNLEIDLSGFRQAAGFLDRLAATAENPDVIFQRGVADMYAEVSERIQQRGEATDGSKIGGGAYSPSGRKGRAAAGRQTSYIDLTMSGDMMDRGFTFGPVPAGGFGLGFVNKLTADRMRYQEKRYNQQIIYPSAAEQARAFATILQDLRNEIAR